jgi:hypothetical protein
MTSEAIAAYLAFGISLVLLVWRLVDERTSYVRLRVQVEARRDHALVRTSIANETVRPKKLRKVFLLAGPEGEDPIDTFNAVVTQSTEQGVACCAKHFELFDLPGRLTDGSLRRVLVPLDYYFEENDNIGNEELSCETPIDWSLLKPGRRYGIRFYVFGHRPWRASLHRKIHVLLAVPGDLQDETAGSLPARSHCNHLRGCRRG